MTYALTSGSLIPLIPPSLIQKMESGISIELGDRKNYLGFEGRLPDTYVGSYQKNIRAIVGELMTVISDNKLPLNQTASGPILTT